MNAQSRPEVVCIKLGAHVAVIIIQGPRMVVTVVVVITMPEHYNADHNGGDHHVGH